MSRRIIVRNYWIKCEFYKVQLAQPNGRAVEQRERGACAPAKRLLQPLVRACKRATSGDNRAPVRARIASRERQQTVVGRLVH